MSVTPFPNPDPDPFTGPVDFIAAVIESFTGIFSGMTIGELMDAMRDVPVQDALKAFIEGASKA